MYISALYSTITQPVFLVLLVRLLLFSFVLVCLFVLFFDGFFVSFLIKTFDYKNRMWLLR